MSDDTPESIQILRETASYWRKQVSHLEEQCKKAYAARNAKEGDRLHTLTNEARREAARAAAQVAPYDQPRPAPLPHWDAVRKYMYDLNLWPSHELEKYLAEEEIPGIDEGLSEAEARVAAAVKQQAKPVEPPKPKPQALVYGKKTITPPEDK